MKSMSQSEDDRKSEKGESSSSYPEVPIPKELQRDGADQAALALSSLAALVPVIGGPLAGLITYTIPKQRMERIVLFIQKLSERVSKLEANIEAIIEDPEKSDLIESGCHQAARATTPERITRIAEIVSSGLSEEGTDLIRRKRLLRLFGEIDDDELIILNAYGEAEYGESPRGISSPAWEMIKRPEPAFLGSSPEVLENENLYKLGLGNLLRLGLFEKKYDNVKDGEYPPFDRTSGEFKSRIVISYLGRMLLKEMGMPLEFDKSRKD